MVLLFRPVGRGVEFEKYVPHFEVAGPLGEDFLRAVVDDGGLEALEEMDGVRVHVGDEVVELVPELWDLQEGVEVAGAQAVVQQSVEAGG